MQKEISISDFSPHLFWDVDLNGFDLDKHKEFMIERVLEYGMLQDWNNIKELYGKEVIKEVSLNLRNLSPVTVSFLSTIFKIDSKYFKSFDPTKTSKDFRKMVNERMKNNFINE